MGHSEVPLSGYQCKGGSLFIPTAHTTPWPSPSRLAGVEILGMLAGDSGHCHRAGTGTPRNDSPVPRCSPGYPCLGQEGSACSSPRDLARSQHQGGSWCTLSTDIHLLGSAFSCCHPLGSSSPTSKAAGHGAFPTAQPGRVPAWPGDSAVPPAQHHGVAGRQLDVCPEPPQLPAEPLPSSRLPTTTGSLTGQQDLS